MSGNKAINLKKLESLGMPVPDFYVIDNTILKNLGTKKIDQKILNDFALWRMRYDVHEVAVRSSADAEDGTDRSYAGQFVSVMKIGTDKQLLAALKKVSTSKPAHDYGHKKSHVVHAIVQRYIEPDSAGVLFTVNPSNGLAEIVINAVKGHGGKAVNGEETTTFNIDRVSGDIRTDDKQNFDLISKSMLNRLSQISKKIEQHMNSPQDIEWAVQAEKIFILQTRPITQITYLKAWDNANIGESFPGIVMPLTFSIARRGYELVYKSQSLEGGQNWYKLEANHRTFHDMVGLFDGRMYYNLASWYTFIGLFPGNHRNQKFLDDQIQTVGSVVYLPPSSYPLRQTIRFYAKTLRRAVFFEREKRQYWRQLERTFNQYDNLPVGQSLQLLLERYTFVEQMIVPHMGRSADNDFFVMTYHGLLKNKLSKWLGEKNGQTANFLGSMRDVISARQAELLVAIADYINKDKLAKQYLLDKNYKKLDSRLLNTKARPLLEEYRAKFLHRFAGDQKIETINPLLSLPGFYSLIETYCKLDKRATAKRSAKALVAEHKRHDRIVRQLSPLQKIIYRLLLRRLKHHLRIREHNRLLRGKTYALLRELFLLVGETLSENHIINTKNDVYYLDIEEILRLVNGTGYEDDVKQIIAARQHRYKLYPGKQVPSRFITTGLTNEIPQTALHASEKNATTRSLSGTLSSPGDVTGKVIVLDEPIIPKEPFDILVVSHTDPGWTPLIALAKGVIVEHGGILSHAAIVTRELGIPSMIGVPGATRLLRSGMKVRINATKGTVDILK